VDTHTGKSVQTIKSAWLDDMGRLFLETEWGLGVVRSLDMDAAADAVEAGVWEPQDIRFDDLPRQFASVLHPAPP